MARGWKLRPSSGGWIKGCTGLDTFSPQRVSRLTTVLANWTFLTWSISDSSKSHIFFTLSSRLNLTPPKFTLFKQWCGQVLEQRGGISIIYSSFAQTQSKSPYMLAWETDLQEHWDLAVWHRAISRSYKDILNTSLIEASLKVLTRWYMTPSRLSSIFPSESPLCFRECQMMGSILHVWWDCTKIRSVWNKIFPYPYCTHAVLIKIKK